jgi:DNA polymerase-3 subunit epsilon
MLEEAPTFADVAHEIIEIMGDAVFVAHNVNFDYSFIKAEMNALGLEWHPKKLCTVRLARKALPGFKSYGLGNLCHSLGIRNKAAHRAMGDTQATVEVFEHILRALPEAELQKMIGRGNAEAFLPNHLDAEEFNQLPESPGVYYMLDQSGKPIYIGKAKNIKQRIKSHFKGNSEDKRLQDFLKEIHHIQHTTTGNELIALLLEDAEIRKHWPKHNSAQKKRPNKFAVYSYLDQRGYHRLGVTKVSVSTSAIKSFSSLQAAQKWLVALAHQYSLHKPLIGLPDLLQGEMPLLDAHNNSLQDALKEFSSFGSTYVFLSEGRRMDETGFVWIHQGELQGYGFMHRDTDIAHPQQLEPLTQKIPRSETNIAILRNYLENPRDVRILRWDKINEVLSPETQTTEVLPDSNL